ncbi:MAG TPA: hypothetical protein PL001_01175 [Candidatus Kryptobacter bacterium]|nr:hypothetical protein [Candidatus Kryptobacter bacterium]
MRDKSKQKTYLKQRAKGDSTRKAAKIAGISHATAIRAEADPRLRTSMAIALDKAGATDIKIASVVFRNLDAKRVLPPGEDGKSKKVDDGQVQLKAAELAGKFRGDFVERAELKVTGGVKLITNVKE